MSDGTKLDREKLLSAFGGRAEFAQRVESAISTYMDLIFGAAKGYFSGERQIQVFDTGVTSYVIERTDETTVTALGVYVPEGSGTKYVFAGFQDAQAQRNATAFVSEALERKAIDLMK